MTGEKLQKPPLSDELTGEKIQDYYLDGVTAARNDFDGKGVFPGVGCGLFGLIGWGVGYLTYAMQDPNIAYYYLKDLDGNCKYHFERGYKSEGKKIRKRNFNTGCGVISGIFLLINLSTTF